MNVRCNAGCRRTNLVGDLPGYGTVWFDPSAITNILSLKRVRSKYKVTYENGTEAFFAVVKPDGTRFEFKESADGLYYLDTEAEGAVMVNTVVDNASSYTNADYMRAVKARNLQIAIG